MKLKKNLKQNNIKVVSTFVSPKALDLSLGVLCQFGFTTVEQKKVQNKIRLNFSISSLKDAKLLRQIAHFKTKDENKKIFQDLKVKTLRNKSWVKEYRKYLKPFCLIPLHPTDLSIWIDPRIKKLSRIKNNTIYLEPGLAFGTGTHPTTQMAALLLAEVVQKNKNIHLLDLGCGSGILAMVAARLGVRSIQAIDNDLEALEVTKKNFSQNKLKGIVLKNSLKKTNKKFDLIVANILLSTLLELKVEILSRLKPGGFLILSGLTYKDKEEIMTGYSELELIKQKNKKGWSAFLLKKS